MRQVQQFSAGFNPGDAISNQMLEIRNYLRDLEYKGDIFSENIGASKLPFVKKYKTYGKSSKDILFYHHSIHSGVFDFLRSFRSPRILIYHNVTPHHFFESYDLKMSYLLKKGREDLKKMKERFDFVFAVSKFNQKELEELEFQNVGILPITYQLSENFPKIERSNSAVKKILFVGRITPNKKQDDLIRLAYAYKSMISDRFQFYLAGFSSRELYLYREELERMLDFYDLRKNVLITGFLSDVELNNLYQEADVFVSMSEHEGFCVPLIEAMVHRIPILAYSGGAVPETLNGAGIIFTEKKFPDLAILLDKILTDVPFQNQILTSQDLRLKEFKKTDSKSVLKKTIETLS
ncbi:glycosyltransferase family 4 protein [Leptospira alstonii]|uniref:Glycosyltransferase, group 1 family protein n=2 Tax=Leptospira alstonii TaxID=28452 RepID=M6CGU6_9LEPT|nr:glycosyltransferase family 4 protein [Leptospira alstonii]EMJ91122.1 glycosyltransferase, group 1 family protein [Leptospira alstonii serovar Sichuan str. 79601]EQA80520.1 glycosyltransferase, group 1 family protein [Leptospira alstonii serovar Pingchang str. 80-412]